MDPSARCYPAPKREWAWAVQLYSLRRAGGWGIGDLGDLLALARWSADLGAGALLVSPLHAVDLVAPVQPSPYYPSSRLFRNPLYVDMGEPAPASLTASPLIDHDAVAATKLRGLEARWRAFTADDAFDDYREEHGQDLLLWATFCVLAESHGRDWRKWPPGFQRPDTGDVARFVTANNDRVAFHAWVQWVIDTQLAAVADAIPLIHDVAVGFDPAGFDAWLFQDSLASGVNIGAPPDDFNPAGQDWGLPPFDPDRLREADYEPFRKTIRAGARRGGGLRVDHVMALFRLWWVPHDAGPEAGEYVSYPHDDLLDVLCEESQRAKAFVVGEDLGTVLQSTRDELHRRGVLSYRVLWFEDDAPPAWPAQSLAAVTTHDLPTIAGVAAGTDGSAEMRERLAPGDSVEDVVVRTYAELATAPSAVVTATLEDAVGVEERPNRPGTTDRENWSRPLPLTVDELVGDERVAKVARALRR